MTDYLLDTNAMVAVMNKDTAIERAITSADRVYLSSIALGEAFYGAEKSGRVQENLQRVEKLAASATVLDCDVETARIYGRLEQAQRTKGRPIGQNDTWIAAMAIQYDLTLLTRDSDFNRVANLKIASW
jgi:tRNA(fMet)-specific endonuclease VapC